MNPIYLYFKLKKNIYIFLVFLLNSPQKLNCFDIKYKKSKYSKRYSQKDIEYVFLSITFFEI